MKPRENVQLGPGEKVTCLRSASEGGVFEFLLEIAPGTSGPPMHRHLEDESIEVTEGVVIFTVAGEPQRLEAGDSLTIPRGTPHSFQVPKDAALRAICRSGSRFEKLVDQHEGGGATFSRVALYLTRVDPDASYMVSPVVRAFLRVVAWIGRLRGVQLRQV